MKFKEIFSVFFTVFLTFNFCSIFSCALLNFENLIIDCSVFENSLFYEKDFIELKFSLPVDQNLTEKMIKISENDRKLELDFLWEDNCVQIRPKELWKHGKLYSLSFSGVVKTCEKGDFSANLFRSFYYGCENQEFFVKQCSIAENECITGKENIVFEFNKNMDENSFLDNFSITPSLDYKVCFEGNIVKIIPLNWWPTNSFFACSFSDVKAYDGYYLNKEFERNFITLQNIKIPTIKKITTVEYE